MTLMSTVGQRQRLLSFWLIVRSPLKTFWIIKDVESAVEPVGERNQSDWLSSLGNQCTRRKSEEGFSFFILCEC